MAISAPTRWPALVGASLIAFLQIVTSDTANAADGGDEDAGEPTVDDDRLRLGLGAWLGYQTPKDGDLNWVPGGELSAAYRIDPRIEIQAVAQMGFPAVRALLGVAGRWPGDRTGLNALATVRAGIHKIWVCFDDGTNECTEVNSNPVLVELGVGIVLEFGEWEYHVLVAASAFRKPIFGNVDAYVDDKVVIGNRWTVRPVLSTGFAW